MIAVVSHSYIEYGYIERARESVCRIGLVDDLSSFAGMAMRVPSLILLALSNLSQSILSVSLLRDLLLISPWAVRR